MWIQVEFYVRNHSLKDQWKWFLVSLLCFNGVMSPLASFTPNISILKTCWRSMDPCEDNIFPVVLLYSLFVMIKLLYGISKMFVGFYLSSFNLIYVLQGLFQLVINFCVLFSDAVSILAFLFLIKTLFFLLITKIEIKISILKCSRLGPPGWESWRLGEESWLRLWSGPHSSWSQKREVWDEDGGGAYFRGSWESHIKNLHSLWFCWLLLRASVKNV